MNPALRRLAALLFPTRFESLSALSDKSHSMSAAGPNAGVAARQRTAPLRCGQNTWSLVRHLRCRCAVSSRPNVRAPDTRWRATSDCYLPDTALGSSQSRPRPATTGSDLWLMLSWSKTPPRHARVAGPNPKTVASEITAFGAAI